MKKWGTGHGPGGIGFTFHRAGGAGAVKISRGKEVGGHPVK